MKANVVAEQAPVGAFTVYHDSKEEDSTAVGRRPVGQNIIPVLIYNTSF